MKKISRRRFCATAGAAATVVPLHSALSKAGGASKDFNILWLMTDQHIHNVMGCAGNPIVQTPTFDKLAAEGARFTQATCVTPFCSPTRASFLTGLYPHTHGVTGNIAEGKVGLKDPLACTESLLHQRGCATEQMGKWHLGNKQDLSCYGDSTGRNGTKELHQKEVLDVLGERAFSEGPRPGEVAFNEYFLTEEMAAFRQGDSKDESGGRRARQKNLPSAMGRMKVKPEHSYEWWLGDRCIDYLKEHKDQRFMMTFSVSPPHAPWIAPSPYYDMYDPKKMQLPASYTHQPEYRKDEISAQWGRGMSENNMREYLRSYYAQVSMMDAIMGRILDELKRLGLEENTLVVYTSDHGDMQGAHHMPGKSTYAFYDETLRVPLIVRFPGRIKPGTVLDCSASSVDLMPTLLDYVGIPLPKTVQGRSLRPMLEGKSNPAFDAAFCERGSGDKGKFGRMIRTATAKYCYYSEGTSELFDLKNDPHEMRNLIADAKYSSLKNELHKRLVEHSAQTKDPALEQLKKG